MSTRTTTRDLRRLLMAASAASPLARQTSAGERRPRPLPDNALASLRDVRPPRPRRHPPWRTR